MNFIDIIKNYSTNINRYRVDSSGVILVAYFNPLNIKRRYELFKEFYGTIKHMPHLIVEGQYETSKLVLDFVPIENKIIQKVESLNWCKEGLLNIGLDHLSLKNKYKYVFWLDADIRFQNLDWMVDSCNKLRSGYDVIQPFKLIKHLAENEDFLSTKKNENIVKIDADIYIEMSTNGKRSESTDSWYSFGYKHATGKSGSSNYEAHGHVGMAWGAKLELINKHKLYPGALIGGADHIMAHAFANHTCHSCIEKTFSYDLEVLDYSDSLSEAFNGKLTFVDGLLLHGWHGDIKNRDYYNRIKNNSEGILKDSEKNGHLYETNDVSELVYLGYMATREVLDEESIKTINETENKFNGFNGGSFGGGGASGEWDLNKSNEITNDGVNNLNKIMELTKNAGVIASISGVIRNEDSIIVKESEIENTFS